MLTWHFNVNNIDNCLTEAIFEDNFDSDGARNREDIDLEGLHKWELKLWPFDLLQRCLRDFTVVDNQHTVHLEVAYVFLAGLFRAWQLFVRRCLAVVLQTDDLILRAVNLLLIVDLELNARRGELLRLSLFLNPSPETIQAVGHFVDNVLLLL